MVQDLDKICTLLDKLTLDSLTLMEMHIHEKLELERAMAGGETNLAKARYIMGQNSVSALQLPGWDGAEFEASATVGRGDDGFDLLMGKGAVDPIRWFGVLVPQALHGAQQWFQRALDQGVRCANTQTKLVETLEAIEKLRRVKDELNVEE